MMAPPPPGSINLTSIPLLPPIPSISLFFFSFSFLFNKYEYKSNFQIKYNIYLKQNLAEPGRRSISVDRKLKTGPGWFFFFFF